MNDRHPRRGRWSTIAAAIGPRELAALARAVPSLETDELARILLSEVPAETRSSR